MKIIRYETHHFSQYNNMNRLLEDHKREVKELKKWSVKLLKKEARNIVWNMCCLLGTEQHGVQGQACRLLERYLALYLMRDNPDVLSAGEDDFEDFKLAMEKRFPMLLASCIQLASKMNTTTVILKPTNLRTCLEILGFTYSTQEIKDSEYHVLSTLEFRLPLWTSTDTALAIALKVNLSPELYEGIVVIVNMCEYHRNALNDRVHSVAKVARTSKIRADMLSTLHLAAGAVLASARYILELNRPTTTAVARLTHAPVHYLRCVCDVIIADIISIEDDEPSDANSHLKMKRHQTLHDL